MNHDALRHALKTVAKFVGLSAAGGLTIWAAIWLPTFALMHFAGWAFLDAYMTGLPVGIIGLCCIGIGVMSYRQKARQKGWQG